MLKGQIPNYQYITVRDSSEFQQQLASSLNNIKRLDKEQINWIDIPKAERDAQETFACIQQHQGHQLDGNQQIMEALFDSHIRFPHLAQLCLEESGIASVEVLPRIYMPELQKLWMNTNNIFSVKALPKTHFPKLNTLCIHGNKLRELNGLQQSNYPQMKMLALEWKSQTGPQNLSHLLKLNSNLMNLLSVLRYTRIDQPKARRQLKAKYPLLQIQYDQR